MIKIVEEVGMDHRGFDIQETSSSFIINKEGFTMEFVDIEDAYEYIDSIYESNSEEINFSPRFPAQMRTSLQKVKNSGFKGTAYVLLHDSGKLTTTFKKGKGPLIDSLRPETEVFKTDTGAFNTVKYRDSLSYHVKEITFDGEGHYNVGKVVI